MKICVVKITMIVECLLSSKCVSTIIKSVSTIIKMMFYDIAIVNLRSSLVSDIYSIIQ